MADDRQDALQRAALATEIARILPGFDQVSYPQWSALFDRFWETAPAGTVLALDEFPSLVAAAREVPSLPAEEAGPEERKADPLDHRRIFSGDDAGTGAGSKLASFRPVRMSTGSRRRDVRTPNQVLRSLR